jgi:hypothetical protein
MVQGKKVHVTEAYVFMLDTPRDVQLDRKEMADYRWTPIRHFLKDGIFVSLSTQNTFSKAGMDMPEFNENVSAIEWPAIELGLRRGLYGLTLYMVGFMVSKIVPKMVKLYSEIMDMEESMLQKYCENH